MKALTIFSTTICVITISLTLTACGGGNSSSSVEAPSSTPTNPTVGQPTTNTPPASNTGKLIIDNGRGTTNNQNTEKPK